VYMKLLTKSLISRFPPLESTDNIHPEKIKVICRFFLPGTHWSWYPTEYDGFSTFFGLVEGDCTELGYFTLEELRQRKGPFMARVERDRFFSTCKLADLMKKPYESMTTIR